MSQFNDVPVTNKVGYIEIHNACQQDISPLTVDLVYGSYRSENGGVYLLPVVKKAEKMVVEETLNHNYLPITGIESFSKLGSKLLLGDIDKQWNEGTIFGAQCIGGSGALKVGAEFLTRHLKCTTVYYSEQSWENYESIYLYCGFQNRFRYRYLKRENLTLDFEGFCEDISNAAPNSVITLHGSGHNPIGIDPTKEQWKIIATIMKERKLIPFFDVAYQGLATGDIEEDVWVIRYFFSEGFEFLCAHSFSKIFTMYNERVGNLTFVLKSANNVDSIKCYVERIIRSIYSSPPNHGARTILKILSDPELYNEWLSSFRSIAVRLIEKRMALRKALEESGAPGTWNHVTDQKGLFAYLIFTDAQLKYLQKFHHVYMINPGRINVSALNNTNINYVAKAITDTLKKSL